MIIGPRRAILIGAIAAVAATIILIPALFSATAPDFNLVVVRLSSVEVTRVEDDRLELRPVFTITNPTDQTITTSKIEYELFADGQPVGTSTISFEDIPLNGRPAIFAGSSVNIPQSTGSPFVVESGNAMFAKIRDSGADGIKWKAQGTANIESTLVQHEKQFESEI
ncbi:hypothetical protein [Nitrososphaera sp.]|uniref:hypothetical protein n=1 Tax=Nitrososphaera sp. TaxID=1971748 RepID=UPI00307FCAFF